jgi:hypothetical protein
LLGWGLRCAPPTASTAATAASPAAGAWRGCGLLGHCAAGVGLWFGSHRCFNLP